VSAAAFLLVLASGFLHAVWNLLTKRSGDKKTFLWAAQSVSALLYLPWTWHDLARTELTLSGWLFLLLHGLYMHLCWPPPMKRAICRRSIRSCAARARCSCRSPASCCWASR